MNFAYSHDLALYHYYALLQQSYYNRQMLYAFPGYFCDAPENYPQLQHSTSSVETSPETRRTFVEEIRDAAQNRENSPSPGVKKEEAADTNNSSSGDEFESVKAVQNKTKDLMRPFARMLYRHFKRIVESGVVGDEGVAEEIRLFNAQVDELRSKNPCKFTEVVMAFIRGVSPALRAELHAFMASAELAAEIARTDSFKHWRSKADLLAFLRQFVTENRHFLKPTKFYKFQFRKLD